MADGKGCKCAAYSESECACDVDWTPQEVYDLREKVQRLEEAIRRIAEHDATLSVCDGNVTVTLDAMLTDAEREAISCAAEILKGTQAGYTLRGLLERTK